MRRRGTSTLRPAMWLLAVGLVVGSSFALSTCGGETTTTTAPSPPTSVTITPADFSATIDNPYLPLEPGTTFIYEGRSGDGASRVEVTVTSETRVVMGVTCVVVRDQAFVDDVLVEDTFDWYAEDKEGNVWYFGEDTKEYENGTVVSTQGSWEAGVNGAVPGVIMKAHPQVGDSYQQEYLKGEAEDMAEVLALGDSATVPYGSFQNVLRTREWTPLEPGVAEEKLYAPGVGLIKAETVEGGSDVEELVEIRK